MSWRVADTCAKRRHGSATRVQIVMFPADKVTDDESGIWWLTGATLRLADLYKTIVKRAIRGLRSGGPRLHGW